MIGLNDKNHLSPLHYYTLSLKIEYKIFYIIFYIVEKIIYQKVTKLIYKRFKISHCIINNYFMK